MGFWSHAGSQPGSIKLEVPPTMVLSVGGFVRDSSLFLVSLPFTEMWLIPGACCLVGDMLPEANRWGLSPQLSS